MKIYRPKLRFNLMISIVAFLLNWFVYGVIFLNQEGLTRPWSESALGRVMNLWFFSMSSFKGFVVGVVAGIIIFVTFNWLYLRGNEHSMRHDADSSSNITK
jgi:hypothetical protein